MSRLLLLQILALTVSSCLGRRMIQRCKLDVDIECPSESNPEPSVSCSTTSCRASGGDSTWYIGVVYERVKCLTPLNLMLKVSYGKGFEVTCSLVPLTSEAQLLGAYTAADVCALNALSANTSSEVTPNATTPAPTTVAPTTTAPLTCPEGWHIFESSCFQVTEVRGTYGQGYDYCTQNGGNLASIRSEAENDFVASIVTETTFFGLSDGFTEGEFFWADGSLLLFENWGYGEPNDYLASEDCTVIGPDSSYTWNDVNCNAIYPYLCRMPAE